VDLGVAYVPITILNDLSVTMGIEYQQDFFIFPGLKKWMDVSKFGQTSPMLGFLTEKNGKLTNQNGD
jgi:hypothetical protein